MSARHNGVAMHTRVAEGEELDVWALNSVDRACKAWLQKRGLDYKSLAANGLQAWYQCGPARRRASTLKELAEEIGQPTAQTFFAPSGVC